jgi:hypothetical protein
LLKLQAKEEVYREEENLVELVNKASLAEENLKETVMLMAY